MASLIALPKKVISKPLTPITVDWDEEYLKKDFSSCIVDNQDLRHTAFRSVDLTRTLFIKSQLIFCAFVHTTMHETVFEHCDLTGTLFHFPENCKIHFISCDLTSVNLNDFKQNQYVLENCWAYNSPNEQDRKLIRLK